MQSFYLALACVNYTQHICFDFRNFWVLINCMTNSTHAKLYVRLKCKNELSSNLHFTKIINVVADI